MKSTSQEQNNQLQNNMNSQQQVQLSQPNLKIRPIVVSSNKISFEQKRSDDSQQLSNNDHTEQMNDLNAFNDELNQDSGINKPTTILGISTSIVYGEVLNNPTSVQGHNSSQDQQKKIDYQGQQTNAEFEQGQKIIGLVLNQNSGNTPEIKIDKRDLVGLQDRKQKALSNLCLAMPSTLCLNLNTHKIISKSDITKLLQVVSPGLHVYSLLHHQLNVNKFRYQTVLLITDGLSANSFNIHQAYLAIQMLQKIIGIKYISCSVDSFDVQQIFQDKFDHLNMIFTPTQNFYQRSMQLSNNMGFDLIIDFSGLASNPDDKRTLIKLLGVMGTLCTQSDNLQLDPPDSEAMQAKSASLCFMNFQAIAYSRLYDGVIKTILNDIIERTLNGDLVLPKIEAMSVKKLFEQHESGDSLLENNLDDGSERYSITETIIDLQS